ncbi:carbohydrate ABC transporter permease [Pseudothermotoga thermarum]|uniref:Carbohydrate ABC transporter membrane protein 1, CUT1 family n=1 Tax=Pseudothermotoga thermarum DSM 5069 TaxID=688269 RepID=F7YTI0_9THEM|nr:sugar ABC transporter permease [Pseudothermotoga thermarum]AEH51194.1 carbohydrate ABC transporter membrane protein 1, CUT1 family [Pseudothermotoga thermarum DSM 5069]
MLMLNRKIALTLVLPAIVLFLVMTIYPFVYMLYSSFTDLDLSKPNTGKFIGLRNYADIFRDPLAISSIEYTGLLLLIAVPIEMLAGLGLAYLIRGLIGEKVIRSLFLLPMMVPAAVGGFAWKMLFNYIFGPVNYFLSLLGFQKIEWFGKATSAKVAVMIVEIWQWTPFVFLILYAAMQSLPKDLLDAGKVDGASGWKLFRYIEFPLLRPIVYVTLLLRVIDVLKTFDIVYMTTFGGPGTATSTWSFYAYKVTVSYGWNIGYGSALCVILVIVSMVLVNMLIRILNIGKELGLERERRI